MSMLGLYVPGGSVVHRVPAGFKLAALAVLGASSVLVSAVWQVGVALGVVLVLYVVAGLPLRSLGRQARGLVVILGVVALFHVLVTGWETAAVVVGVITTVVLAAGLVTLTTRLTDLVDVLVRLMGPLRRWGVDPDRVALLLAMSVRSVPVVIGIAEEVRDAQRARGLTSSPRAYGVPLLVRSLRHADRVGEALVARGLDD